MNSMVERKKRKFFFDEVVGKFGSFFNRMPDIINAKK